jgi:hypothetical protein
MSIREKIAEILKGYARYPRSGTEVKILRLKVGQFTIEELVDKWEQGKLVELAKDQELPDTPLWKVHRRNVEREVIAALTTPVKTPEGMTVWKKVKED